VTKTTVIHEGDVPYRPQPTLKEALEQKKIGMYEDRIANISAFRGCKHDCVYCAFKRTLRFQKCDACRAFEPHAHLEALLKKPPKTKPGQFVTVGLTGDIAFATKDELQAIIRYCNKYPETTFVLQTKDPRIFLDQEIQNMITGNMIIGTTIETNINKHGTYSKAPSVFKRLEVMEKLDCRKMITIEPIIAFSPLFGVDIANIHPEIVWVGYDSKNHKLLEPSLYKTINLIEFLRGAGIDVREKLIRKAWNEE